MSNVATRLTRLDAYAHALVHTLVFPGASSDVALPPGGSAGQVLAKASDADYDFVWVDPPAESTNTSPIALDDAASTMQGQQIVVAVLANDSDADGDELSVTHVNGIEIVDQGIVSVAHGSVVLVGGTLLFEPHPDYAGPVSFTYTIADGRGGDDTATVSITVTPSAGGPSTQFDGLYAQAFALDAGTDAKEQPSLAQPAKSASILDDGYVEPVFGTRVRRTTSVSDVADSVASLRHEYSRRQAFNADSSRVLLQASNGFWYLQDADTLAIIPGGRTLTPGNGAIAGLAGDCEPCWHPTDPAKIWYTTTNGGLVWYERDIVAGTTQTLFDLGPLLAQTAITNGAAAWFKGEGRPSNDGRWWAMMIDDASHNIRGLVMYDREAHEIVGHLVLTSNRPDHISTSPLGHYAVPSWYGNAAASLADEAARPIEQAGGVRAYTRDFSSFVPLSVLGEHSDLALDAQGRECFVGVTYHGPADGVVDGSVFCRPIAAPDEAFSTAVNAYGESVGMGIHISGTARHRLGWVVVTKYAGVGPGPYDGQVVLVELVEGGRALRLAHHRGVIGSNYWAEPHASASPDLTRVVFASDWGNEAGPVCDYQIVLPSWAVPGAAEAEAPENVSLPIVTPSPATTDDLLTSTTGNWSGFPAPAFTFQWMREGIAIEGATAATYLPTAAGAHSCRVSATNASGTASAVSEAVSVTLVESEPPASNVLAFSALPDGTLLAAQAPGWSAAAANYAVAGGALQAAGNGYDEGLAFIAAARGADQSVQVTRRPSTTDGYAELIVHIHASEGNAGYVAKIQQANVQLYRGAEYQGQAPHGVDLASETLTLRLANFGGRVRLYLNGSAQPLLELVDPAPIVDGAQGLNIYANGDTSRHQVTEFRYS